MAKLCGVVSLVIFAISVICHVCTFIPGIHVSMGRVWPLHPATMAVVLIMVLFLVGKQGPRPRKNEFQSGPLALVPRALRWACLGVFLYAILNFGLFFRLMEGGSPAVDHGTYSLRNRDRKIRDLTEPEYQRFLAYEVRGFSGHWMFFSLVPAIYFLVVYPRLREPNKPDTEARG
jgi:hypothetical protein